MSDIFLPDATMKRERWPWTANLFVGNGDNCCSEKKMRPVFARNSLLGSLSMSTNADDLQSQSSSQFDPNDRHYRCCCGQAHSTTGVRIIAGLLCLSVAFEFWQLCWNSLFSSSAHPSITGSSLFQLFFGLLIVSTILVALWRENAALLLPYLLFQAFGLAGVFIIFLALFYVLLDNDLDTLKSLVESYGPANSADFIDHNYLAIAGVCLLLLTLGLLALQLWLLFIVFSCWRYFRDKSSFFRHTNPSHLTNTATLVLLQTTGKTNTKGNERKELGNDVDGTEVVTVSSALRVHGKYNHVEKAHIFSRPPLVNVHRYWRAMSAY